MKKKLLAICLTVATTSVFAQASKHEGFYFGADLGFKSTGGEATGLGIEGYDAVQIGGKNSLIPSINAEYKFALSDKALLGVGFTYDISKTKLGTSQFAGYDVENDVGVLVGAKGKEKNHYSLFLKPGYLVSPTTEVYGLLAYHKMKVTYDFDAVASNGINTIEVSGSDSSKHTGFGYGAGVRTELSKNIYGYVQVQQVKYKSKDDFKPSTNVGSIGIQYKFD
jgi:opacity protein-like surface antigen